MSLDLHRVVPVAADVDAACSRQVAGGNRDARRSTASGRAARCAATSPRSRARSRSGRRDRGPGVHWLASVRSQSRSSGASDGILAEGEEDRAREAAACAEGERDPGAGRPTARRARRAAPAIAPRRRTPRSPSPIVLPRRAGRTPTTGCSARARGRVARSRASRRSRARPTRAGGAQRSPAAAPIAAAPCSRHVRLTSSIVTAFDSAAVTCWSLRIRAAEACSRSSRRARSRDWAAWRAIASMSPISDGPYWRSDSEPTKTAPIARSPAIRGATTSDSSRRSHDG